MSTTHTPEPLAVKESDVAVSSAHRAVACVNACRGINPEAVPALLQACKAGMGARRPMIAA